MTQPSSREHWAGFLEDIEPQFCDKMEIYDKP